MWNLQETMESQAGAKDFMFTFHQGVVPRQLSFICLHCCCHCFLVCVVHVCVLCMYVCVCVRVCVHVLVGVEPAGDHEDPGWCQRNRVHLCPITCH